jgi:hypothetical protein
MTFKTDDNGAVRPTAMNQADWYLSKGQLGNATMQNCIVDNVWPYGGYTSICGCMHRRETTTSDILAAIAQLTADDLVRIMGAIPAELEKRILAANATAEAASKALEKVRAK